MEGKRVAVKLERKNRMEWLKKSNKKAFYFLQLQVKKN